MMLLFMGLACGPAPVVPMLEGTLTPEGHDLSGDFFGYQAFGFDNEGTLLIYIASHKEASCETVAPFLRTTADPIDPSILFEPGSCNLMLKTANYAGSWEAENDRMESASSAISCNMGEGEWLYETGANSGYYWSGKWWVGFPTEYTWSVTGDRDSEYIVDIEMTGYEGSFAREEFSRYAATGTVKGTVTVQPCMEIGQSGHF